MELNSVVFPSSPSSYTYKDLQGKLIFIPRLPIISGHSKFDLPMKFGAKEPKHIPCLYLANYDGSSKIVLYFHGNAEDIGHTYDICNTMKEELGCHVISVEYPSYGIYPGSPSAHRLIEDAINVFDYVSSKWDEQNIILVGRSIGSGPVIHLGSCRNPASIVLISPYTSIKSAVKSIAGKMAQLFVKERFENKSLISQVNSPVFLLHGQKDTFIPYTHSQELLAACRGVAYLHLPENMDHCSMDYTYDLCKPFAEFMKKCGISTKVESEPALPQFSPELFALPVNYPTVSEPGMFKKLILKFV